MESLKSGVNAGEQGTDWVGKQPVTSQLGVIR
jgi:hypothetical protein